MRRIPESLLVVYVVGPMPRPLSFPIYMLLKLMLPREHPFMGEIRVSFLVVTVRVINLFLELLQSLFLRVLLPVEVGRLVGVVRAFCRHKVINQDIEPHFVAASLVHGEARVDAVMHLFVVFAQLLFEPPDLFKL